MANSSMFVLPRIGIPAALILATTVESYGGTQPWRILLPQVVGIPRVVMTSLTAIGTPASVGRASPRTRRASTPRAVSSADSEAT